MQVSIQESVYLNTGEHLQGYLAHTEPPPHRILQKAYAWGPMVVLGGGRFLMSEVPLSRSGRQSATVQTECLLNLI